jgi:cytochrome o ubiquinol oxidase operon protein cyoD
MEEMERPVVGTHYNAERGTLRTYVTGFVLSIAFTLIAYFAVVRHTFSGNVIIGVLLSLAIIQFVVQLFYFLHIGRETKPRWKLLTLFLMLIFVLIVVLGSIWVMYNLSYRMSPEQMQKYMLDQSSGGL